MRTQSLQILLEVHDSYGSCMFMRCSSIFSPPYSCTRHPTRSELVQYIDIGNANKDSHRGLHTPRLSSRTGGTRAWEQQVLKCTLRLSALRRKLTLQWLGPCINAGSSRHDFQSSELQESGTAFGTSSP